MSTLVEITYQDIHELLTSLGFSSSRSREIRSDSLTKLQLSRLAFRKPAMLAVVGDSLAFWEEHAMNGS